MLDKSVLYVQCFDHKPESLRVDDWFPWLECGGDRDTTAALVANKFVRNRGGLDGQPLTVFVFCYWKGAPLHKGGGPMVVDCIEFKFTRRAQGGAA